MHLFQSFKLIVQYLYGIQKNGFPHSSVGKNMCLQCRRPGFNPWVGKIPWSRKWQPTPVFLLREFPWTEEPGELQCHVAVRVGHG